VEGAGASASPNATLATTPRAAARAAVAIAGTGGNIKPAGLRDVDGTSLACPWWHTIGIAKAASSHFFWQPSDGFEPSLVSLEAKLDPVAKPPAALRLPAPHPQPKPGPKDAPAPAVKIAERKNRCRGPGGTVDTKDGSSLPDVDTHAQ